MNKELTNLGLSPSEAKVYLAALRLGQASVGRIAKQAGVKRPTTYLALEELARQSLVSEIQKEKIRTFKAESPRRLSRLTRKMRRGVIRAELELDKILPELKSIQKKILSAPQVTFHEGKAGAHTVLEDLTASREQWYFFGSSEQILKQLTSGELDDLTAETDFLREQAGRPKAHIITDMGIFSIKHFQIKKAEVREVKILPRRIEKKSAFCVYGNKIGIFSLSGPAFGTIIESEETAELLKMVFKIIWDNLE